MPSAGAPDTDTVAPPYAMQPNDNADALKGVLSPINTYPGAVSGRTNLFDPNSGDYPKGGRGQVVGGLACRPIMFTNDYHVHVYIGIVDRGKQVALPHGIGMNEPGTPVNGFTNTANCFYYLHTHDSSGIVHVEVPDQRPLSDSAYSLGLVLHVWGLRLSKHRLGPIDGPLHVFVGNVPLKQTTVSSYTRYDGDANAIPLKSHEVIWLEFGAKYYTAKQLPPVTFYMEY
jgi:hypothetical protein